MLILPILLFLAPLYLSQRFTAVDAAGNIVAASYATNPAGATTATLIISTISAAPAQPAAAAVATPAAINGACTTEGCKAPPTTYLQDTTIAGVYTQVWATFTPATPAVPVPTVRSAGSIMGISQYITTTFTSTLFTTIAGSGTRSSNWAGMSDGGVFTIVAVIAGLIGAVFVL